MTCRSVTVGRMTTDEVRIISIDMSGKLDTGELLTGTPTIEADAALTITGETVNGSSIVVNGATLAAGKAVQFKVTPSTSGRYVIDTICTTDAGQTIEYSIVLVVEATAV